MRLLVQKSVVVGFALAAALLLAAGFVSYRSLAELTAQEAWVEHTHLVLTRLELVLSLLKDAETGQRGYLLTGDTAFLEPLRAAQPRLGRVQRALDSLTADNPSQQQRLDTLRAAVGQRQGVLYAVLADYRRTGRHAVNALRQGKARMDRVRDVVANLQAQEQTLLAQRRAAVGRWARRTPRLLLGFTALALLSAALSSWQLSRSRLAQDNVRRQRATLQSVLDASPDGMTLYEPVLLPGGETDFRLALVNPAAAATAGLTRAHVGQLLSALSPDGEATGRFAQYRGVMATGEPWAAEFFSQPFQRWFGLAATRANRFLLITFADITARKQQEQAALDYEQRKYEAVFQHTRQLMVLLDAEGRALDVNETLRRYAQAAGAQGHPPATYLADRPTPPLPPALPQLPAAVARAAQGEAVHYDTTWPGADGELVHLHVSLRPVHGPAGNLLFLLGEGTDVSERVHAEQRVQAANAELQALSQTLEQRVRARTEELEQSRARFAQLLETIPNMAWTGQPDGTISYYNRVWYDYTGLTPAQLLGTGWQQHIHPDDLAPTQAAWEHALTTGEPLATLRNRWRRARDGEYRWHLVRGVPLRDEAGRIVLWVGTNTDIHDQQLQQQELERVNGDLETFVYTASHDLKTPIHNIEGLLVALREDLPTPTPEVTQLLDLMQDAIERFRHTLGHLTDVARLQAAEAVALAPVDVAAVAEGVRQDLAPLLASTDGQLTVSVAACPVVVWAENHLRSVVYNLLSNALKYRDPRRRPAVALRTYPDGKWAVLEVTDNGLGLQLNEATRQRLFGFFKRLHDHVDGSGVGLYMVKRLVDNAGGRIEVESALGAGTTFRVFLPQQ